MFTTQYTFPCPNLHVFMRIHSTHATHITIPERSRVRVWNIAHIRLLKCRYALDVHKIRVHPHNLYITVIGGTEKENVSAVPSTTSGPIPPPAPWPFKLKPRGESHLYVTLWPTPDQGKTRTHSYNRDGRRTERRCHSYVFPDLWRISNRGHYSEGKSNRKVKR